ncbi:reverse transcriptase domain-containing protein [Tanacetum coccineum]
MYKPRNAIKWQVLVDFLSEALVGAKPEIFFHLSVHAPKRTTQRDGPFSQMGRRIVKVPGRYEALLAGLCMAAKMKVQEIDVKVDSKLVASQINGSYVVSSTSMIKYLATAKECIARFKSFTIHNIPKNSNQKADVLSKLDTIAFEHLTKKVLVEVLSERSTDRKVLNAMVKDEEDNWMTPIIKCLREGVWPEDKAEARALRMKINQPTTLLEKYTWEPVECTRDRAPKNTNDLDHGPVAVLPKGDGYLGSVTIVRRKCEVCHCGHRLFDKVDQGKAINKDYQE